MRRRPANYFPLERAKRCATKKLAKARRRRFHRATTHRAFPKPIGSKPTINNMLFVFREALKAKHNIAVTVRVPAIYCYYPVKGDPFCSALLFVNNGLINCVCCRRNSADCQEGVTSLIRKKEKMINLICFIGERENKYTNKITLLMVKST